MIRRRAISALFPYTTLFRSGADDGDRHIAAGVGGCWRIERPVAAARDDLVRRTGDGRRGVIFHRHRLAALSGVAAGIACPPRAPCIEGIAAMAGEVGHGADD